MPPPPSVPSSISAFVLPHNDRLVLPPTELFAGLDDNVGATANRASSSSAANACGRNDLRQALLLSLFVHPPLTWGPLEEVHSPLASTAPDPAEGGIIGILGGSSPRVDTATLQSLLSPLADGTILGMDDRNIIISASCRGPPSSPSRRVDSFPEVEAVRLLCAMLNGDF
ncbi:hypothetical protein ACHAWU_003345 [Discostella pseudostelligera]|uniref:Uncharacterized protein n=1 Tax=Discostella pseudostelligera TaxID=259834 RepID=A0ABD3N9V8_9STRA